MALGETLNLGNLLVFLEMRDHISSQLVNVQRRLLLFSHSLQATARVATVALTVPITAAVVGAVYAAAQFESAFAGVAKTVEGVSDRFGVLTPIGKKFRQEILDLAKAIPVTQGELAKIAETLGQMNVPIDRLKAYTEAVARMAASFANVSAEKAAFAMSRFLEKFKDKSMEGPDRFASMITELGNTLATNEGPIIDILERISRWASTVGVSMQDTAAIAGTLVSTGVRVEAGGSAINRVLQTMHKVAQEGGADLRKFADISNMSAQEFQRAWEDDPGEVFLRFVSGIADAGKSAGTVLEGIGIRNIRQKDAIIALARSYDNLVAAYANADKAYESADAHIIESDKRFGTLINVVKLLWNHIRDLGISLGTSLLPALKSFTEFITRVTPVLDSFVQFFVSLPVVVQTAAYTMALLVAAIGPLLFIASSLIAAISPFVFTEKGKSLLIMSGLVKTAKSGIGALTVAQKEHAKTLGLSAVRYREYLAETQRAARGGAVVAKTVVQSNKAVSDSLDALFAAWLLYPSKSKAFWAKMLAPFRALDKILLGSSAALTRWAASIIGSGGIFSAMAKLGAQAVIVAGMIMGLHKAAKAMLDLRDRASTVEGPDGTQLGGYRTERMLAEARKLADQQKRLTDFSAKLFEKGHASPAEIRALELFQQQIRDTQAVIENLGQSISDYRTKGGLVTDEDVDNAGELADKLQSVWDIVEELGQREPEDRLTDIAQNIRDLLGLDLRRGLVDFVEAFREITDAGKMTEEVMRRVKEGVQEFVSIAQNIPQDLFAALIPPTTISYAGLQTSPTGMGDRPSWLDGPLPSSEGHAPGIGSLQNWSPRIPESYGEAVANAMKKAREAAELTSKVVDSALNIIVKGFLNGAEAAAVLKATFVQTMKGLAKTALVGVKGVNGALATGFAAIQIQFTKLTTWIAANPILAGVLAAIGVVAAIVNHVKGAADAAREALKRTEEALASFISSSETAADVMDNLFGREQNRYTRIGILTEAEADVVDLFKEAGKSIEDAYDWIVKFREAADSGDREAMDILLQQLEDIRDTTKDATEEAKKLKKALEDAGSGVGDSIKNYRIATGQLIDDIRQLEYVGKSAAGEMGIKWDYFSETAQAAIREFVTAAGHDFEAMTADGVLSADEIADIWDSMSEDMQNKFALMLQELGIDLDEFFNKLTGHIQAVEQAIQRLADINTRLRSIGQEIALWHLADKEKNIRGQYEPQLKALDDIIGAEKTRFETILSGLDEEEKRLKELYKGRLDSIDEQVTAAKELADRQLESLDRREAAIKRLGEVERNIHDDKIEALQNELTYVDKIEAAAKRLGVDIGKLGTGYQHARIGADISSLIDDIKLLQGAGTSLDDILGSQVGGEEGHWLAHRLGQLMDDALKTGLTVLPKSLEGLKDHITANEDLYGDWNIKWDRIQFKGMTIQEEILHNQQERLRKEEELKVAIELIIAERNRIEGDLAILLQSLNQRRSLIESEMNIRLQAISDRRSAIDSEMNALLASLGAQRMAIESAMNALLAPIFAQRAAIEEERRRASLDSLHNEISRLEVERNILHALINLLNEIEKKEVASRSLWEALTDIDDKVRRKIAEIVAKNDPKGPSRPGESSPNPRPDPWPQPPPRVPDISGYSRARAEPNVIFRIPDRITITDLDDRRIAEIAAEHLPSILRQRGRT